MAVMIAEIEASDRGVRKKVMVVAAAEMDHGMDCLGGDRGGLLLVYTGEGTMGKWLIGRFIKSDGSRGSGMFLLDKNFNLYGKPW